MLKWKKQQKVDNALGIADENREKIKLQTFDLRCFNYKSYFDNDWSQNYLIFQPIYNTCTRLAGDTETIIALKSKRLSDEIINPATLLGNVLAPKLKWIHNSKISAKFKDGCL